MKLNPVDGETKCMACSALRNPSPLQEWASRHPALLAGCICWHGQGRSPRDYTLVHSCRAWQPLHRSSVQWRAFNLFVESDPWWFLRFMLDNIMIQETAFWFEIMYSLHLVAAFGDGQITNFHPIWWFSSENSPMAVPGSIPGHCPRQPGSSHPYWSHTTPGGVPQGEQGCHLIPTAGEGQRRAVTWWNCVSCDLWKILRSHPSNLEVQLNANYVHFCYIQLYMTVYIYDMGMGQYL